MARKKSSRNSREKALVKLNQLENLLKDRQKQLGGMDAMKRQLEQLKATRLARPISSRDAFRGDRRAADALEKLKQELSKSGLDEKQNLSKQLEVSRTSSTRWRSKASDSPPICKEGRSNGIGRRCRIG